jgi:3-phenylpropionate/cinnamic acid dioxygenase small subunit
MEISKDQLTALVKTAEKMNVLELQYKYVRSVDTRDWKTSVEVFHPEGVLYVVEAGKKKLIGGKPEIEAFFREIASRDFIFARHSITNPVVNVDGDKASFKSYYHTTFVHDTFTKVIFGYYDDKIAKEKREWKVMEKQIIMGWSDFLIPLKELKANKENL